jgi:Coenzyme PQQ synthesis protein D (PqqD)
MGGNVIFQLRTDELNWRQIDDEIVALDGRGSAYVAINGSGALLWPSLVRGATHEQLVSVLVDAYGIDGSRAAVDTEAFLRSLEEHGLLRA